MRTRRHQIGSVVSAHLFCLAFALASLPAAAAVNRWTAIGPDAGNVAVLAIVPSTASTLFAGTDAGVLKSTDGGQSWATTAALPTGGVLALAQTRAYWHIVPGAVKISLVIFFVCETPSLDASGSPPSKCAWPRAGVFAVAYLHAASSRSTLRNANECAIHRLCHH